MVHGLNNPFNACVDRTAQLTGRDLADHIADTDPVSRFHCRLGWSTDVLRQRDFHAARLGNICNQGTGVIEHFQAQFSHQVGHGDFPVADERMGIARLCGRSPANIAFSDNVLATYTDILRV
jgi:hypothetical protein